MLRIVLLIGLIALPMTVYSASSEPVLVKVPEFCKITEATTPQKLGCLRDHFVYEGKVVNPRVVNALLTWLSDDADQVVAINLEGSNDSNRYHFEDADLVLEPSQNGHSVTLAETAGPAKSEGSFAYEFAGRTKGGVIVLRTMESGGGSGTFTSLLLLRAEADKALDEDGGWTADRVILKKLGEMPLGDRAIVKISITGNMVSVDIQDWPAGTRSVKRIDLAERTHEQLRPL